MSEKAPSTAPKPAAAAPPKRSMLLTIVGMVLPALFAAGAAYGASRFTMGKAAVATHAEPEKHAPVKFDPRPPGPTVALEPFLVTLTSADKKPHAMRLTLAIEFESGAKEETTKNFTPRIRDAVLSYLRSLSYEEATDRDRTEKIRAQILERCHAAGAMSAERILITDVVIQ
jgi:flagellar basal body-associated protein FliL